MKRMSRSILSVVLLMHIAACGKPVCNENQSPQLTGSVDAVMSQYASGIVEDRSPVRVSGWMMTNESGITFSRSTLQHKAQQLIKLGPTGVPDLVDWLENEDMHLRYIAAYALGQLTGEKPFFPCFATLAEHRDNGWLADASDAWTQWHFRWLEQERKYN